MVRHNGCMETPERPPLIQLPPARFRMLPFVLAGTALWVVALVVLLVAGADSTARDVAIAGIGLGVPLAWWSRRMDARLP